MQIPPLKCELAYEITEWNVYIIQLQNLHSKTVSERFFNSKKTFNYYFEIVYPIYQELNEIIEQTKPAKTSQIKIKTSSREHWEVIYTCEFCVDQWSYNIVDEITERLADQLTMKQDLNGGLLIQVSFKE